jgi:putative hydrolase of the HAD superfamily
MGAPRAVLFDLDDTLIQEKAVVDEAFDAAAQIARERRHLPQESVGREVRRSARKLWYEHPDHDYAARVGISSWEALWARFMGEADVLKRFRSWAPQYRREAWACGLRTLGIRDDSLAERLSTRFIERRRELHRPFPDTRAVLGQLRGPFRLGLLTNGLSCLQREKIIGSGLESSFDSILVSGDVGVGKPDPLPYRLLLDRLAVSPSHAVMVGDNPERDLAGARAAGVSAVWIDRGHTRARPEVPIDLRLESLARLPEQLEEVLP